MDGTLSLSLRMLTALAFVPPEDMDSLFKELIENTPEKAHDMIPYMERTCIGSSTYANQQKSDGTWQDIFCTSLHMPVYINNNQLKQTSKK